MPDYRYIAEFTTIYPDELTEQGSLVASLGTEHEWAVVPPDGRWAPVESAPAVQVTPPEPAPKVQVPATDSALD